MECTLCGREAVYEARYSGEFLCASHFTESVEKRIRREIREQIDFSGQRIRISVAISGGKDSSVTLFSLANHFRTRRDVELNAFTIDEGIEGYRSAGLESARKLSAKLGIRHNTVSFSDVFGTTMDRIVTSMPDVIPCSRCGPMRRQIMDTESMRLEADYVALGMNLDDYSQSVLMNVARGDVDRLVRMAPHHTAKEGMVRRILPLRRIPEKEVMLYAILKKIEFDSSWCPYYGRAQRNNFREVLETLEEHHPGTKYAILGFHERIRALLPGAGNASINRCEHCGRPTSGTLCSVCSAHL